MWQQSVRSWCGILTAGRSETDSRKMSDIKLNHVGRVALRAGPARKVMLSGDAAALLETRRSAAVKSLFSQQRSLVILKLEWLVAMAYSSEF
jgi:hypothetical protein